MKNKNIILHNNINKLRGLAFKNNTYDRDTLKNHSIVNNKSKIIKPLSLSQKKTINLSKISKTSKICKISKLCEISKKDNSVFRNVHNKKNSFFEASPKTSNIISRILPPAIKQWSNSIYSFNKNFSKNIPSVDNTVNKIIRSYFTINPISDNPYGKKTKLITRWLNRRSLNRILVSKPEIKHSNDKVFITIYLFNKKKKSLLYKLSNIYKYLYYNNKNFADFYSRTLNFNRYIKNYFQYKQVKSNYANKNLGHSPYKKSTRAAYSINKYKKTPMFNDIIGYINLLMAKYFIIPSYYKAKPILADIKSKNSCKKQEIGVKGLQNNDVNKLCYTKLLGQSDNNNEKSYKKNSLYTGGLHFNNTSHKNFNFVLSIKGGAMLYKLLKRYIIIYSIYMTIDKYTINSCLNKSNNLSYSYIKNILNKKLIYNKLHLSKLKSISLVQGQKLEQGQYIGQSLPKPLYKVWKKDELIKKLLTFLPATKNKQLCKGLEWDYYNKPLSEIYMHYGSDKFIESLGYIKYKSNYIYASPSKKLSLIKAKGQGLKPNNINLVNKYITINEYLRNYICNYKYKINQIESTKTLKRLNKAKPNIKANTNTRARKLININNKTSKKNLVKLYELRKLLGLPLKKTYSSKINTDSFTVLGKRSFHYIKRIMYNIILLRNIEKIDNFVNKYGVEASPLKLHENNNFSFVYDNTNNSLVNKDNRYLYFNKNIIINKPGNAFKYKLINEFLDLEYIYIYYIKLLSFNNSIFKNWFLNPLKKLISLIYNKKVIFNLVSLKYLYLNSHIFIEAIVIRLRNYRKNRLNKVLNKSLELIQISKPNVFTYDYHTPVYKFIQQHYNSFKYLKSDIFNNKYRGELRKTIRARARKNINIGGLPLNNTKLKKFSPKFLAALPLKNNIKNPYPAYANKTLKPFTDFNNKYIYKSKLIKGLNYAQSNIINLLRHKSLFGVRLEIGGRLTKRSTASRAIFKFSSKGNLKNNYAINRSNFSFIFKNNIISNLQYTKVVSKTRNGAYGIKGWLNNN